MLFKNPLLLLLLLTKKITTLKILTKIEDKQLLEQVGAWLDEDDCYNKNSYFQFLFINAETKPYSVIYKYFIDTQDWKI